MFVMAQDEKTMLNLDTVSAVYMNTGNNADIPIFAKSMNDEKPNKLGRYGCIDEAKQVLFLLAESISENKTVFFMPLSALVAPETKIQDARVKRKGSS
ncbi:MAG: hypothetical protein IKS39_07075 [Clostridia bacterium]|nr:hypothetical protein [Clostridia bacterium]